MVDEKKESSLLNGLEKILMRPASVLPLSLSYTHTHTLSLSLCVFQNVGGGGLASGHTCECALRARVTKNVAIIHKKCVCVCVRVKAFLLQK